LQDSDLLFNFVQDPGTGNKMEKSVFVVFYAGERARHKITKVCKLCVGAAAAPFLTNVPPLSMQRGPCVCLLPAGWSLPKDVGRQYLFVVPPWLNV
jgi:hypothetical protein